MPAVVRGRTEAATIRSGTWRYSSGQIESLADPRTICMEPRRPGKLRARRDGFSAVLRCWQCRGCLELLCRLQAKRLHAKYQNQCDVLWACRIEVTKENCARLNHALHRRPRFELESGLLRDGPRKIIVLARKKKVLENLRRELRADFYIVHISVKRGAAAFRPICAGVLIQREQYGRQKNRWYVPGLPRPEKLDWEIERIPYQKGYDKRRSPRAFRADGRALYPPDLWAGRPRGMRAIRNAYRHASDSDSVRLVDALVFARPHASAMSLNRHLLNPIPQKPQMSREEQAARVAKIRDDAARAATAINTDPLLSGGRCLSSVHTNSRPPPALSEHDRWLWAQRAKDAKIKQADRELFERFGKRGGDPSFELNVKDRGKNPDPDNARGKVVRPTTWDPSIENGPDSPRKRP